MSNDLDLPPAEAALAVHIAEYEGLKGEQVARIIHRNSLIYATIAAVAGTVYAVTALGPVAALLLPPVTLLLGWTYLADDSMVSDLGRYIRLDLTMRVEAAGVQDPFGWERHHRRLPGRTARKVVWLLVNLLVFVAPAVGAVAAYWTVSGPAVGWLFGTLSGVEGVAAVLLGVTFIARADMRGGRR